MFEKKEADVIVIGAGPVGMFSALLLSARNLNVQIFDRDWRTATHSYALALHPQTLELLDEVGLASDLIAQGRKVTRFHYIDGDTERAQLDFGKLDSPFPFVLVLPQSQLEGAFEARLRANKVKVQWNHRVQGITCEADRVILDVARLQKESMGYPIAHTEWIVGKMLDRSAPFVIGADGYQSRARDAVDIDYVAQGKPWRLAVFEFESPKPVGDEVRVVFRGDLVNVFWPLPGQRCRWAFQIEASEGRSPSLADLQQLLTSRVSWEVPLPAELRWASEVVFEPHLATTFAKDRIWLAGDSSHLAGPIGTQSMNVGLSEARDVAARIIKIKDGAGSLDLMSAYDRERQAEWRRLLGIGVTAKGGTGADAWVAANGAQIVPTVPASGDYLDVLLGQIGLELTPGT